MKRPNKIVDRVDHAFYAIADWSIRNRMFVALFTLALVALGLFWASKAQVDNSIDSFFYKGDPAYIAYKDYANDFTSDEVIYIMYSAQGLEHGPFNLEVMRTIATLTKTLEDEVPFVREATSLANVEFMRPVGQDDIEIDELLINFPATQAELLTIRDSVLAKPMYTNYLVSEEADHAAIILQMEVDMTDTLETITFDKTKPANTENIYPVVSDHALRKILARPEFSESGITFYLSGDVALNTSYMEVVIGDTIVITFIALGLITLLSLLMFRASLAGIFGPITVVIVSIILTVGLLGLTGWKISNFFSLLPTLICAVGIAQSVHILLEFQRRLALSGDRNEAVKAALHKVGGPCLMAALTTAVGLGVMSVSDLRMLAEFGVYAAFGVLATFVFSVTLLVIFLAGKRSDTDAKRPRQMKVNPLVPPIVEKAIAINLKHPTAVLWTFAVVFAGSFAGMTELRNDFNFLHDFKPHVEFRQDTEKIEQAMGGTLRMSYLIDTKVADGVKNPQLLKHIERLQAFAEQNPIVKKTLSVVDVIKDLNQTFNGNNSTYYRVPDQQDLLAQYFLVYEMSGGQELEEFVSYDFSRTVLEFQIEMAYASKIRALLNDMDAFLVDNPLPNAEGRKTGMGLLWVKLGDYISNTQITSYSLVFSMIALFMCINFGSIKVGLLSMIPNLTPVVIALGAMGWTNIPLDYTKLLLATIAIGIAVDDTIHLVTRYRARFYETGNYERALTEGLRDVGPALVVTSCILVVAFAAYLFSNTTLLSNFGFLLGGTILAALLADLFLMPVMLMKTKPFGAEFQPTS